MVYASMYESTPFVRRDNVGVQNNKTLRLMHKRVHSPSHLASTFNAQGTALSHNKRRRVDVPHYVSRKYSQVEAAGTNSPRFSPFKNNNKRQGRRFKSFHRKSFSSPLQRILGVPNTPQLSQEDIVKQQIDALQNILELATQPQVCPPSPARPIQWTAALLDSSSNLIGAMTASLPGGFPFTGQFLPDEIKIKETSLKSAWRHLKNDPSTPFSRVVFISNGEAGRQFKADLWKHRKAAVISIIGGWEMHIAVASMSEEEPLVGYICPEGHLWNVAREEAAALRTQKKLAAAIDIDDTLLKLIRFEDSHKYPSNRIKHLPMFMPSSSDVVCAGSAEGPEWVVALSSGVECFLEEASKYYKLCPYSVGMPKYVREVAELLDPQHKYFAWDIIEEDLSSARHEHDQGDFSPKRFERIFSFANLPQGGVDYSLCVAVDDSMLAWYGDCRERVIDPRPRVHNNMWDSDLMNALEALKTTHSRHYGGHNTNM